MLTKLQKRKMTALFHHQDLNGDNVLEASDYGEFAKRICKSLGLSAGSPEYDFVHSQIAMDSRQDEYKAFFESKGNRLSVDDYLEYHDGLIHNEDLLNRRMTEYVHAMLKLWDQNGDGMLSADEYLKLEWCYGVDEEAARESFGHLDRDGDGYLTLDEGMQAVNEFYLSDDPDAPGNWLFGPY